MRIFPALDLTWPERPDDQHIERILAELDDERPTAVEVLLDGVRVFFPTTGARARAAGRVPPADPAASVAVVDVPDEEWAERSQRALEPVRVGTFVVATPAAQHTVDARGLTLIVINPSMGFGTGHHATTRRCLSLLQSTPIAGARVLDIGTGSGVLAIAAWRLGAGAVVAADCDADALQSAAENIALNGAAADVTIRLWDLERDGDAADLAEYGVVTANLTGGMLCRAAASITRLVAPGGHLILSGVQIDEEAAVVAAFAAEGGPVVGREEEDGWVGLLVRVDRAAALRRPPGSRPSPR